MTEIMRRTCSGEALTYLLLQQTLLRTGIGMHRSTERKICTASRKIVHSALWTALPNIRRYFPPPLLKITHHDNESTGRNKEQLEAYITLQWLVDIPFVQIQ